MTEKQKEAESKLAAAWSAITSAISLLHTDGFTKNETKINKLVKIRETLENVKP